MSGSIEGITVVQVDLDKDAALDPCLLQQPVETLGTHWYPTMPSEAVLAGLQDTVAFGEFLHTFRNDDVDQLVDGIQQGNRSVVAEEFWIGLLVK